MTIALTADTGIPLPISSTAADRIMYRERAQAAVNVIKDMLDAGGSLEITQKDREKARAAASSNDKLPVTVNNAGALLHLEALLTRYDFEFLDSVHRLRRYITNRLLEETNDEDPRIRLRALELLGKTSDVAMFSDQVNINVTHRTVEQVDAELAQLAEKYMGPAQIVETAGAAELETLLDGDASPDD